MIELQHSGDYNQLEKTMDVTIFEDFESLSSMQHEWDTFMEEIRGEVFLTYDWCRLWWKYYGKGRVLKIFVFRQHGHIIGILPLFRDVVGLGPINMSFIKIVGTDFIPITINIPIKKDHINDIIKSVVRNLNELFRWDIIYIGAICGKCETVEQIEKAFIDALPASYNVMQKTTNVQTYFKIADSMEKQIASFNKTKRKRLRQFYNNAEENGKTISDYAEETNYDVYFNAFVNMHQTKWQKEGQAGHFGDWPDSYNFHYETASTQLKHGRLRLLRLKICDQDAGYQYSYKFGETYYLFLNARVEEEQFKSLNYYTLLLCEDAKHAMAQDIKYFDAMRGRYDYKLYLGGYLLPVRNIFVHSRQPIKLIRILSFRLLFSLIDILYIKIWRRRVLPRLGIRPAQFNKLWIRTHMLSF
jgi:hypothetical protein